MTIRIPSRRVYQKPEAVFEEVRNQIFTILARDQWRRKRYLEFYKTRWHWRKKKNKNLAVWELYDRLAAL